MAEIKIFGGTAKGNTNLCDGCRYGVTAKGFSVSQQLVSCSIFNKLGGVMPFPVAECSHFMERYAPFKDDMEKLALLIDGTHIKHEGFAAGTKDKK